MVSTGQKTIGKPLLKREAGKSSVTTYTTKKESEMLMKMMENNASFLAYLPPLGTDDDRHARKPHENPSEAKFAPSPDLQTHLSHDLLLCHTAFASHR